MSIPEPVRTAEGALRLGTLTWVPALRRPDLLAAPVRAALEGFSRADQVHVAEIDPGHADTAAMTEAYQLPLAASVNCVLVAGKRSGDERVAACAVRATTRADVNSTVRRLLDVRKASFWPMDQAVAASDMEYGGITPIGIPETWRLLVDSEAAGGWAIIGSGVRRSKLLLPGEVLAALPGAETVDGLGLPVGP